MEYHVRRSSHTNYSLEYLRCIFNKQLNLLTKASKVISPL